MLNLWPTPQAREFRCVRSTVQSVSKTRWSKTTSRCCDVKTFYPATFEIYSVVQVVYLCHQAFVFHWTQLNHPLHNFNCNIFYGIYFLLIYTNSFLPGPETETKHLVGTGNQLNTIKTKLTENKLVKETQIKHVLPRIPRLPTTQHSLF